LIPTPRHGRPILLAGCTRGRSHIGLFFGDVWLFGGFVGLFYGYTGLFCGHIGLFCGCVGLFWQVTDRVGGLYTWEVIYMALLRIFTAFWRICRSLLWIYGTVVCKYRSLWRTFSVLLTCGRFCLRAMHVGRRIQGSFADIQGFLADM